ncbi:hypothetical protein RKE29_01465 [Streptomyces sp. B1866]|uniref:hypothetical protein n=1 Tax=Streptomyces sp. B1866 TaxID=3075431 RepID=UPI00289052B3|nr:hypothetical protein [Streptomyces sp. B1866]MDT3395328.1 hypothetical protein [Streptomyces sp. B1866]
MSPQNPTPAVSYANRRLAGAPVVRRDARWWLVAASGSLPVNDPAFSGVLDRFAADLAAADRCVADALAEPEVQRARDRGRR